MRILVVNITRIGDQLQTSPTIAGLKEMYPESEITVLGDRQHMAVCRGIPGVDQIYELDLNRVGAKLLEGGVGLVSAYRYVEDVVRDLRERGFSRAFNFSSSTMSSVFMRLLRIADCRGWTMDTQGNRLIANPWSRLFVASVLHRRYTAYNLVDMYCRVAGVRPRAHRLWYTPTADGTRRAAALLAEAHVRPGELTIALQPGASNPIRRWPAESFAVLGRLLQERLDARLVLVGNGEEAPLCADIARRIGERAVVVAGKTDLPTLAALLATSALLVTGDTGPMHLATAVATPVVAFYFGHAYVWETGPYGQDNIAFQTRAPCSPCHHALRCLAPICRDALTPEMVFWAVRDRIARDFSALSRRARDWNDVDVYRIGFDSEGMAEPIPLVPRPDAADVLRLVYREMWRLAFDEAGDGWARATERLGARWSARGGPATAIDLGPPRRALAALHRLAARGESVAGTLVTAASGGAGMVERLESAEAEVERVDAEIERLGNVEESVATVTGMFSFGKENLTDTRDVYVLSKETLALYESLGRWAALSGRLLDTLTIGSRDGPLARGPRVDRGLDEEGDSRLGA